jgi:hypothetical protein
VAKRCRLLHLAKLTDCIYDPMAQNPKSKTRAFVAVAEPLPLFAAPPATLAPASSDACLISAPTALSGAALSSSIGVADSPSNGANVAGALTLTPTTIENGNSSPSGSPAKNADGGNSSHAN